MSINKEGVPDDAAHDSMAGTSNVLEQDFDLLSDFQVTEDAVVAGTSAMDTDDVHQLSTSNLVNADINMMIDEDHTTFPKGGNVIGALTGEDIVFDHVGSEISIAGPNLVEIASTMPSAATRLIPQTVTLPMKVAVSAPQRKPITVTKTVMAAQPTTIRTVRPPGQPITISVGNNNQQGSLAQFITSIRPPLNNPVSVRQPIQQARTVPVKTFIQPAKKQPNIAPAGQQLRNMQVIMTQDGQQLMISSPMKTEDGVQRTVATSSASIASTSSGQQIVFLSPVKGGAQQKLVQMRPKTIAPAPMRTTTSSAPQTITIKQEGGGQKPVQIIRLVSAGSSSTANNPSTFTLAGLNRANLRPIAPNTTRLANSTGIGSSIASLGGNMIQKVIIPSSSTLKAGGNAIQIATSSAGTANTFISTSGAQMIMLPANFLSGQVITANQLSKLSQPGGLKTVTFSAQQSTPITASTVNRTSFVPIAPSPMSTHHVVPNAKEVLAGLNSSKINGKGILTQAQIDDANRQRKPCNCTKSQCLKLYCDCFANGEFCNQCNCNNCFNNLDHEEDRQKAIKQCLDRNPHAFHPKIGKGRGMGDVAERRHTKGCNCRRSGCLKNYCECYEGKILCTELCKCCGCKNYEDSFERKTLMHLADAAEVRSAQQSAATKTKFFGCDFVPKLPIQMGGDRLPCSFITSEVLEATCQCLLATAESGEKRKWDYKQIESAVLEEFGRCLTQIIDTADKAKIAKTDF